MNQLEQGLVVLTESLPGHSDPLLRADKLIDPWDSQYVYVTPGPSGSYLVISYGADGRLGGEAGTEEEDVTSDDLAGSQRTGKGTP